MKERLELVTDFSSLRAGDYVEVRPCAVCGNIHRGILIKAENVYGISRGQIDNSIGWKFEPTTNCDSTSTIKRYAVEDRRIYRINTGLETQQTTTKTRELVKR